MANINKAVKNCYLFLLQNVSVKTFSSSMLMDPSLYVLYKPLIIF